MRLKLDGGFAFDLWLLARPPVLRKAKHTKQVRHVAAFLVRHPIAREWRVLMLFMVVVMFMGTLLHPQARRRRLLSTIQLQTPILPARLSQHCRHHHVFGRTKGTGSPNTKKIFHKRTFSVCSQ